MRPLILISTFIYCVFLFSAAGGQQYYPNIPGEILLDDDRVVVQHFVQEPGVWEGPHSHPEYQLVIVLNSSNEVTILQNGKETVLTYPDEQPERIPVWWRPGPVELSDQHDSANTGDQPIEWIAITFKSDSIATDNPPTQIRNQDINK